MQPLGSLDRKVLRPIVFTQPSHRIPSSSWKRHAPFVFWLIDVLRPKVIADLGGRREGCGDDSDSVFLQAAQAAGVQAAYTAIATADTTAPDGFPDGSVDLLHVDGLAAPDAIEDLFARWRRKLSARGVVVVHGITGTGETSGLASFWEALEREHPSFSFPHADGLGIAAPGGHLAGDVRWLLTDVVRHPDATRTVRRLFAALGARVTTDDATALREAIARLEQHRDALQRSETALRTALQTARQDADGLRREFAAVAPFVQPPHPPADDDAGARLAASGLFDAAFYAARYPDVAASGQPPLQHFLAAGAREGRQPHPLFSIPFYLRQQPHLALLGLNPLLHFLTAGPDPRAPHPLFDCAYYLAQAPDVARAGVNPLVHFLAHGWREGRRPNPYFDPRWYLAGNADVTAAGGNPLAHFAETGWRENRDPSPEFSLSAYLSAHPDVAAAGRNPLEHYLTDGIAEGRLLPRDIAVTATATATAPAAMEQLVLRVTGSAAADADDRPTVVFVSHVVPVPARAGNEYRALRLLSWLRAQGYRVLLVVAAAPDAPLSDTRVQALTELAGNVIVCLPDGRIRCQCTSCPDVLAGLDGRRGRRHPDVAAGLDPAIAALDRALCHDVLIDTVRHVVAALSAPILLVQYVWMARLLAAVAGTAPAILDTIDVYSTKTENVRDHGIDDHALTDRDEAARLALADLVLAIQDSDRARLRALTGPHRVITAGVDFDVAVPSPPAAAPIVLLIGSDNPMNRQGLKDFLRLAWPSIRSRVPAARLLVAGRVGRFVPRGTPAVEALGLVEDLRALYARARVVINPAVAGTGLKIKTVEALAHLRPIVAWPNGVEGLPDTLLAAFPPMQDWGGFAEAVTGHLLNEQPGLARAVEDAIRAFVSPAHAYGALAARLAAFHRAPAVPARA